MEKDIINIQTKKLPIVPLTKKELHETAVNRVHLISKEFTEGFNFLKKFPLSVTIFGGSQFKEDSLEYKKAQSLAGRIASELKYAVFSGGGPGIMEAVSRGAKEAGGQAVGLTIELAKHQVRNPYLTKHLGFHYFFSRKVSLAFSAEAYIFCPGGFGTFDEFFEIVTLVQTKKIERVPIILFGADFWKPFKDAMEKEMLGRETIDQEDLDLFTITDSEEEIIEIIKNAPVHNGDSFDGLDGVKN